MRDRENARSEKKIEKIGAVQSDHAKCRVNF